MKRIFIDNKTGEKVSDLTIYKFELFDAWGDTIHKVEVLSNNSVITTKGYLGGEEEHFPVAVTEETVSRIKEIIYDNRRVLTYKKHISPSDLGILDGYYESFFYRCGDKSNIVHSDNIYYCDGNDLRAETVKSIHEQIADVLVEQGFEIEYFLLYRPKYFAEDEILDLEDALEVANRYMSDIEYCEETGDAFIFYDHELMTKATNGPQPTVILKRGGKRVLFLEYAMNKRELGLKQEDHKTIAEYVI